MKTVPHYLWLCLAILLLALGGCKSDRKSRAVIFPEGGVSNPHAALFLEHLQKQDTAYEQFAEALAGHAPLYEEAKIKGTSEFGYCYWIPYMDVDSVVCGAIYYTMLIDSIPAGQETFPLNDYPLGHPEKMDVERLYKEYGIYDGYLFSMSFLQLRDKGCQVPQELVEFAEVLDDAVIPLPSKEYRSASKVVINNTLDKCKSLEDTLQFLQKEFVESGCFVGKPAGLLFDAYKSLLPVTRAVFLKPDSSMGLGYIPLEGVRLCYSAEGSKAPAVYLDVYFDDLSEEYYAFHRKIPAQNHHGNRKLYYVINMKVRKIKAYIHAPAEYGNLAEYYRDSVYLECEGNLIEPEVIWAHQDVYVPAYERMRRHLHFEGDTLNWDIKNAAEVKVSQNIYDYVIDGWRQANEQLRSGDYYLFLDDDCYYGVFPKNKSNLFKDMLK